MEPLLGKEIKQHLRNMRDWNLREASLEKEYKFKDFRQTIEFIKEIAEIAEREKHHPDILLHDWNNVRIALSTHTLGGISEKDFSLASKIDDINLTQAKENEA